MFSLKLTRQPRKNFSMAQNKKYVFAQRDVDDFSCIKLTEGPFSDIIYTYTNVKFASEENASGQLPLKFTYDIMANPNKEDVKSDDFRNYIGDILVECVEETSQKQISVHLDMRNWLIIRDGDLESKKIKDFYNGKSKGL